MAFYRQAVHVLGELRSLNGNTRLAGQRYELRFQVNEIMAGLKLSPGPQAELVDIPQVLLCGRGYNEF